MGKIKLSRHGAVALLLSVLVVGLSAGGCSVVKRVERKTQTASHTVKLEGARAVEAEIEMGAGQLFVAGGAADLMEAELTYSNKAWRPRFDYDVQDGTGELTVSQDNKRGILVGADRTEWNLSLNDDVPLKLDIELGAGVSNLALGALNLEKLEVSGGAGKMIIDLTGTWDHDVDVDIDTGVGSLTLRLPEDFGVRIDVDLGIGKVNADGFTLDGGHYVNDTYADGKEILDINIDQGVGEVILELVK